MLREEVDILCKNPGALLPHIQTGRLRALAVACPVTWAFLPKLPTFAEAGMSLVESDCAFGVAVSTATPAFTRRAIAAELAGIVVRSDFKDRLASLGTEPLFMNSARATDYVNRKTVKWPQMIRMANVKSE